jgi:hypothetical protein
LLVEEADEFDRSHLRLKAKMGTDLLKHAILSLPCKAARKNKSLVDALQHLNHRHRDSDPAPR